MARQALGQTDSKLPETWRRNRKPWSADLGFPRVAKHAGSWGIRDCATPSKVPSLFSCQKDTNSSSVHLDQLLHGGDVMDIGHFFTLIPVV